MAEAVLCLAQDDVRQGGGFWTLVAQMGDALVKRLTTHAGFAIDAFAGGSQSGSRSAVSA